MARCNHWKFCRRPSKLARSLYAEEAFPLCDLYEKAVTPLSIFYALIGKYPPSAGPCADRVDLDQGGQAGLMQRTDRRTFEECSMIVDYVLGGIVTAALLIYLAYVLLRPERF
jgi:K+-transporting ATPase KdpF subunit